VKKPVRKKQVVKFDALDPIIVSAVRIVDPPSRLRDDFRRAMMSARYALVESQERRGKLGQIKKKKDAAKALEAALLRVDAATRNAHLPPELVVNFVTLRRLAYSAKQCRKFVETPAGARMQEPASDKRDAVHHAHRLLETYGSSETKGQMEKFCELAALLANTTIKKVRSVCKAHVETTGAN
jgi:hypothetical protein